MSIMPVQQGEQACRASDFVDMGQPTRAVNVVQHNVEGGGCRGIADLLQDCMVVASPAHAKAALTEDYYTALCALYKLTS